MSEDLAALRLGDFGAVRTIDTRWADVDIYGHVNNVVYYSYFDTAVNAHLIEATGTDIRALPAIGVVAETQCSYLRELVFPGVVSVGLAVSRLGTSSVTYRIGLFQGEDPTPAAIGRFVHVYIDAVSRRPVAIPDGVRAALERL
jgi:acyl-CoA thioester hydrolase